MNHSIFFRITFLLALALAAQTEVFAGPYIAVGTAHTKKTIVAFPEIKGSQQGDRNASLAKLIHDTVVNDLTFMDTFSFLAPSAFIENTDRAGITPEAFKMTDWTSISTEFLVKAQLTSQGDQVSLEAHLYDTFGGKQVLAKRYLATVSDVKTIAHTLANNIVVSLTGLPGIFLTKIAMSCDRGGNKKEIYIMNFDGGDVKQITRHRSIAFSPAWSPDGSKLAYSVFSKHRNNIKNIDLYEFNFADDTYRMLSNRKGINSGVAYSPDGRKMALTMSFLGNPEIFTLEPSNNSVSRLTRSFGVEVDPTWSPDGKSLAFVSSRSGVAMIYRMNADGSGVQRLTYAGKYNASPSWSPQNGKIVFAGWLDGRFDLFTMNPDGSHIERLTKAQGSNEDPYFSPDGNFIAFSSNRTGQNNVYIANADGTYVRRMTYGLGNCVAPKWSNPPR